MSNRADNPIKMLESVGAPDPAAAERITQIITGGDNQPNSGASQPTDKIVRLSDAQTTRHSRGKVRATHRR